MKLCYGRTSPFSRKVRVAAIECGLADRIELVTTGTMGKFPDPQLVAVNPLAKVPALVTDNGDTLFDSRVIVEYLDSLHAGAPLIPPPGPLRWRALRRQSLGDGLMEALIFLVYAVRRPDGESTTAHIMDRQRDRVERCLDVLDAQCDAMQAEGATIGCITIGCAIGWLDFRYPEWGWRAERPSLAAWYATFAKRPSMIQTAPT